MSFKRFLLLAFVILSCALILMTWTVNMTQQSADAARPFLITAVIVEETGDLSPSTLTPGAAHPGTQSESVPTLSDILEDQ